MALTIENTTGRLLHPVYKVPSTHGEGMEAVAPVYQEPRKDQKKALPGVPPGRHRIDETSRKILEAHRGNMVFFEPIDGKEPMLKIYEATPRSEEEDERHQPQTIACKPEAIAAFRKKTPAKKGE